MVALTGVVVGTVASGGLLSPAFASGAAAGVQAGLGAGGVGAIGSAVGGATTATAVGASAAVGGSAGAMVGASAAGAGAAAAAGATGGAVTGAAGGAALTSVAAGVLTGPVGWCLLGTTEEEPSGRYTFDCWKQILHDQSSEPSTGKRLRDIVMDPRIKKVTTIDNTDDIHLPHLLLENVWDEQFRIDYVRLSSDQLAAHAVKM